MAILIITILILPPESLKTINVKPAMALFNGKSALSKPKQKGPINYFYQRIMEISYTFR